MQTPVDLGPWPPATCKRLQPYCQCPAWSSSPQFYHCGISLKARDVPASQFHLKKGEKSVTHRLDCNVKM